MTNAVILVCYRESPLLLGQIVNGEAWSDIGGLYRILVDPVVAGHEDGYALQFLVATLGGDSTLQGYAPGGVWRDVAPPGTATPFVIVAHQSGQDVLTLNAYRVMTPVLYQVKAVGPASLTSTLMQAASRIDALLGRTSGSV